MLVDLNKLGLTNSRVIVSRKRTRQLFDLSTLWKKTVLSTLEEAMVTEDILPPNQTAPTRRVALVHEDPTPVGPRSRTPDSDDGETIYLHRRSSPVNREWRYGGM